MADSSCNSSSWSLSYSTVKQGSQEKRETSTNRSSRLASKAQQIVRHHFLHTALPHTPPPSHPQHITSLTPTSPPSHSHASPPSHPPHHCSHHHRSHSTPHPHPPALDVARVSAVHHQTLSVSNTRGASEGRIHHFPFLNLLKPSWIPMSTSVYPHMIIVTNPSQ